jgi:hypothetical protein
MTDSDTQRTLAVATVLLLVCLMLVVAHGAAQKISVDYDAKADLTSYKTYAWIECKRPANSKLNHEAVIAKINHHLAAIGLRRVDEQQPDLYVSYRGGIVDCVSYDVDSLGNGGTIERIHQEATLMIQLIEVKTRRLVWVGRAAYTLSDTPATNDRRIDQTISKILKKYPSTNE